MEGDFRNLEEGEESSEKEKDDVLLRLYIFSPGCAIAQSMRNRSRDELRRATLYT